MERENDLRKNEIRSLEERQQKDNQVKIYVFFYCGNVVHFHFPF